MKVLLASSEVHPYSKSGGLADMVGALAKFLGQAGHEVGLVTPLYRGLSEKFPGLKPLDFKIELPLGREMVKASVWTLEPSEGLTIYFIEQPHLYHRLGLYQEGGFDYPDNAQRFIFFSKCVAHLARYLPWKPELIHVHDWQAALTPLLVLHQKGREGWADAPRTCLTIHNLAYQGNFPRAQYELTNLPLDYFHPNGLEFYGQFSCLKAGLTYADVITAVSPRYAREITTLEYGCGLEGVLLQRQDALFGILNGVDYEEWNTTHNRDLRHLYSRHDLAGKALNKLELQKELGLPLKPDVPVFGGITRLTEQKGISILLPALEEMLATDLQFVALGSGALVFETALLDLARRYPTKVAVRLGFDQGLSHRIEAGADFFLMPSRFEPCGLNQMYSQRYATIPIVRKTGGLDDTVIDLTEDPFKADGIKFTEYSAAALAKAIRKALVLYAEPDLLRHLRLNAMKADFSWQRTSKEYVKVFATALAQGAARETAGTRPKADAKPR